MNLAALFAAIRPIFGTLILYSQQIAMGFVILFGTFGTLHIFRKEYGAAIRCAVFVFLIISLFFGGMSFSLLKKTGGLFPSQKIEQVTSSSPPIIQLPSSASIRPIEGTSGVYAGGGTFHSGGEGVYTGGGFSGGGTLATGLMQMLNNFK